MSNLLLQQGLILMLFGMGTVFIFLTLLVFVTRVMSSLVQNYFPEEELVASGASVESLRQPAALDAKKLEIIREAVKMHRAKTG